MKCTSVEITSLNNRLKEPSSLGPRHRHTTQGVIGVQTERGVSGVRGRSGGVWGRTTGGREATYPPQYYGCGGVYTSVCTCQSVTRGARGEVVHSVTKDVRRVSAREKWSSNGFVLEDQNTLPHKLRNERNRDPLPLTFPFKSIRLIIEMWYICFWF